MAKTQTKTVKAKITAKIKKVSPMEKYRKELDAYTKWLIKMQAQYGNNFTDPMATWDTVDYNQVIAWNQKLSGMEELLSLTKQEVDYELRESNKRTGYKMPKEKS